MLPFAKRQNSFFMRVKGEEAQKLIKCQKFVLSHSSILMLTQAKRNWRGCCCCYLENEKSKKYNQVSEVKSQKIKIK